MSASDSTHLSSVFFLFVYQWNHTVDVGVSVVKGITTLDKLTVPSSTTLIRHADKKYELIRQFQSGRYGADS